MARGFVWLLSAPLTAAVGAREGWIGASALGGLYGGSPVASTDDRRRRGS
jgi:hypothetical protein